MFGMEWVLSLSLTLFKMNKWQMFIWMGGPPFIRIIFLIFERSQNNWCWKKHIYSITDCCVNWSEYSKPPTLQQQAFVCCQWIWCEFVCFFFVLRILILIIVIQIVINLYGTFVFPVQSTPLCRFFCFSDDYRRHSNNGENNSLLAFHVFAFFRQIFNFHSGNT